MVNEQGKKAKKIDAESHDMAKALTPFGKIYKAIEDPTVEIPAKMNHKIDEINMLWRGVNKYGLKLQSGFTNNTWKLNRGFTNKAWKMKRGWQKELKNGN